MSKKIDPWLVAMFAIAALFAAREFSLLFKVGEMGRDLQVVCAALAAVSEGKDPYTLANIGGTLPFPLAIVTAYPAKFLCHIRDAWPQGYIVVYFLVLVCSSTALSYFLFRNAIEFALVAIVSISAFAAFRMVVMTGNIAIF